MAVDLVCLGEVLVDIFEKTKRAGGASLNVATITSYLGIASAIISAVGDDENGKLIKTMISNTAVRDEIKTLKNADTGYAKVELDEHNKPHFELAGTAAYDNIQLTDDQSLLAEHASVLYVGTLAQRNTISRKAIQDQLISADGTVFYDVNLREGISDWKRIFTQTLPYVSYLKLSVDELDTIAGFYDLSPDEVPEQLFSEVERLHTIFITKGNQGAEAITRNGRQHVQEALVENAVDTTGCGDAFCAGVISSILAHETIEQMLKKGTLAAAVISRTKGAIPGKEWFQNTMDEMSTLF
ncbi:MAG: PfkB family carbohydrate kinase [Candidatus Woesearchaeota archaeon]